MDFRTFIRNARNYHCGYFVQDFIRLKKTEEYIIRGFLNKLRPKVGFTSYTQEIL